jgi:hypothetical protein
MVIVVYTADKIATWDLLWETLFVYGSFKDVRPITLGLSVTSNEPVVYAPTVFLSKLLYICKKVCF